MPPLPRMCLLPWQRWQVKSKNGTWMSHPSASTSKPWISYLVLERKIGFCARSLSFHGIRTWAVSLYKSHHTSEVHASMGFCIAFIAGCSWKLGHGWVSKAMAQKGYIEVFAMESPSMTKEQHAASLYVPSMHSRAGLSHWFIRIEAWSPIVSRHQERALQVKNCNGRAWGWMADFGHNGGEENCLQRKSM